MKRTHIIAFCITGTATAIAIGYFGVQFLGRNTIYAISGGTIGLGMGTLGIQVLEKKRTKAKKLRVVD
ncbi:hypothetical protein WKK05_38360 (plasmid) [Nostoc sp. UHCC 0302]|uniref:hypothetical protein n=1 Tax=Nostoc sp. UHCC 0302 TaxID=3134896 RepID=UPI00311CCEC3